MKKKSVLIVILAVVLLAAAVAVLAAVNARDAAGLTPGELSVTLPDGSARVYGMDDISAMESVEFKREIVSSGHENDSGLFRGVPLCSLLAGNEDCEKLVVRSEDGFVAAFSAEEVFSGDVVLVYMKDGGGLGTLSDGGTGPFRIIVLSDDFGNRCAKYVCGVELK